MEVTTENNQTRWDAMRDLPVKFRWIGVGKSPQPESKPGAVEIAGNRVELEWPEKGYSVTRVFFRCPVCKRRCRLVYALDNGGIGCHKHVTSQRKVKEAGLLGLRRAARMGRSKRWKQRAKQLRAESVATLASL